MNGTPLRFICTELGRQRMWEKDGWEMLGSWKERSLSGTETQASSGHGYRGKCSRWAEVFGGARARYLNVATKNATDRLWKVVMYDSYMTDGLSKWPQTVKSTQHHWTWYMPIRQNVSFYIEIQTALYLSLGVGQQSPAPWPRISRACGLSKGQVPWMECHGC